jgi:hypothetical protein
VDRLGAGYGAAAMLRWFDPSRARNFLPWFGCLFGAGLISSVKLSLLEGPSLLVLAVAVLFVERRRGWLAGALMGLAGLGRETNLFATGMLLDRLPRRVREAVEVAGWLVLAGAPFLVWSVYVRSLYPSFNYSNPASFALPFSAYLHEWKTIIAELQALGWASYARYNVAVIVGLTVQAVFLLTRWQPQNPWWRVGIAYCLLMPTLSTALWFGYPGSAARVLLPMTVAFNALVTRSRWFWPLVILGNLSVWYGLESLAVAPLPELM